MEVRRALSSTYFYAEFPCGRCEQGSGLSFVAAFKVLTGFTASLIQPI